MTSKHNTDFSWWEMCCWWEGEPGKYDMCNFWIGTLWMYAYLKQILLISFFKKKEKKIVFATPCKHIRCSFRKTSIKPLSGQKKGKKIPDAFGSLREWDSHQIQPQRRPVLVWIQETKAGKSDLTPILHLWRAYFSSQSRSRAAVEGDGMRLSAETSGWRGVGGRYLVTVPVVLFRGALLDQFCYSIPEELAKNSRL